MFITNCETQLATKSKPMGLDSSSRRTDRDGRSDSAMLDIQHPSIHPPSLKVRVGSMIRLQESRRRSAAIIADQTPSSSSASEEEEKEEKKQRRKDYYGKPRRLAIGRRTNRNAATRGRVDRKREGGEERDL